MSWSNPNAPNLADFTLFVQSSMGIPTPVLPADSPWLGYAFNEAMNLVLYVPMVAGLDYTLAVYNCAGHILLRITPDAAGQDYFETARNTFRILAPSSGVIASSSDQSTSNSFAVPEGFTKMTVGDLEFMRTPWGRSYLAYAQSFGDVCGLT